MSRFGPGCCIAFLIVSLSVGLAAQTLVQEREPNNVHQDAQRIPIPCRVNGTLGGNDLPDRNVDDRDLFKFQAPSAGTVTISVKGDALPGLCFDLLAPIAENGGMTTVWDCKGNRSFKIRAGECMLTLRFPSGGKKEAYVLDVSFSGGSKDIQAPSQPQSLRPVEEREPNNVHQDAQRVDVNVLISGSLGGNDLPDKNLDDRDLFTFQVPSAGTLTVSAKGDALPSLCFDLLAPLVENGGPTTVWDCKGIRNFQVRGGECMLTLRSPGNVNKGGYSAEIRFVPGA